MSSRVVRAGDIWVNKGISFRVASFTSEVPKLPLPKEGPRWACDSDGDLRMHLNENGEPLFDDWERVSLNDEAALVRLREIADFHADRGGTDLDRALRSIGR